MPNIEKEEETNMSGDDGSFDECCVCCRPLLEGIAYRIITVGDKDMAVHTSEVEAIDCFAKLQPYVFGGQIDITPEDLPEKSKLRAELIRINTAKASFLKRIKEDIRNA